MKVFSDIRKNTYFDSVALMIISRELKEMPGISEALAGMATELNKELLTNLGLMSPEIDALGANDFFVSVKADSEGSFDAVNKKLAELLQNKVKDEAGDYRPPGLAAAVRHLPKANIAIVSLPGRHAAAEVEKALDENLHVMLFSDNVSLSDEVRLKKKAHEKGLFMMGPDCGTAIINGVALCFANVVRRGRIGVVGASGTGIQELTTLIDKLGGGISHALGTGGRDLKAEVGGIMMLDAIDVLSRDANTDVLVIISKPPAKEIAAKMFDKLQNVKKKTVVHFLGGSAQHNGYAGYSGKSLEDTARKAVLLEAGKEPKEDFTGFTAPLDEIERLAAGEAGKLRAGQKYLRGLYSGGTLAYEALLELKAEGIDCYSNIPLTAEYKLQDSFASKQNTVIDFGEDEFTVGKPHPMIDASSRQEAILKEAGDPEVAIILLDIVTGYGASGNIVGEMIDAVKKARVKLTAENRHIAFIGFICGTEGDKQGLSKSEAALRENGVVVLPSNAQAARFAYKLLAAKKGGGKNE
ncbi:MAG: acyl-CoA synthetase FdrA [Spirochaetes bacterium]|nr:acyl-CoA synthetase FdrA [Spirochaetota bacterium]